MQPEKSRLLIEEIIVPDMNAGIEEGWMDGYDYDEPWC